jgi:pilus assembly protein CpaB
VASVGNRRSDWSSTRIQFVAGSGGSDGPNAAATRLTGRPGFRGAGMKPKSLMLLAVAVGCGLVAMMGVQQVLSRNRNADKHDLTNVLVATADIPPGVPLDETNTTFKSWPKSNLPEGAITKREQVEDRSLRLAAVAHEVILETKLGKPGQHGGSMEIPDGLRVGTVSVNTTKTHSGLILPGDYVDVVVTYKTRIGGQMRDRTKTILERIQVFATDNVRKSGVSNDATDINAKNISLLVNPHQYNVLMLAEQKGEITLALRNRNDDTVVDSESVDDSVLEVGGGFGEYTDGSDIEAEDSGDVRKFLEDQEQPVASKTPLEAPAKPTWTVRIYEGGTLREEKVELPEDVLARPAGTAPDSGVQGTGSGSWQGWLEQFLIGA